jgi:hypothetical protein
MERVYRSPNENYRKYADQVWSYNCDFVASLHNTTTPAQRAHAAKKIKGWESDIQKLLAPLQTAQTAQTAGNPLPSRANFPALR